MTVEIGQCFVGRCELIEKGHNQVDDDGQVDQDLTPRELLTQNKRE